MDKIKIGDIIWIEYAGEPTKVKVLNIDKDHLLVRGVRPLGIFPSWMGKKVLSKHDYHFCNFKLLNPGK
jgi:hypothetical protein